MWWEDILNAVKGFFGGSTPAATPTAVDPAAPAVTGQAPAATEAPVVDTTALGQYNDVRISNFDPMANEGEGFVKGVLPDMRSKLESFYQNGIPTYDNGAITGYTTLTEDQRDSLQAALTKVMYGSVPPSESISLGDIREAMVSVTDDNGNPLVSITEVDNIIQAHLISANEVWNHVPPSSDIQTQLAYAQYPNYTNMYENGVPGLTRNQSDAQQASIVVPDDIQANTKITTLTPLSQTAAEEILGNGACIQMTPLLDVYFSQAVLDKVYGADSQAANSFTEMREYIHSNPALTSGPVLNSDGAMALMAMLDLNDAIHSGVLFKLTDDQRESFMLKAIDSARRTGDQEFIDLTIKVINENGWDVQVNAAHQLEVVRSDAHSSVSQSLAYENAAAEVAQQAAGLVTGGTSCNDPGAPNAAGCSAQQGAGLGA